MNVGIAMRGEKKVVEMRLVAIPFVLVGSEDTAPVWGSMVLWTPPNHVVLVDRAEDRNLPRRFWMNHWDLRFVNSLVVKAARRLPLLLRSALTDVRSLMSSGRDISHPWKNLRLRMRGGVTAPCVVL